MTKYDPVEMLLEGFCTDCDQDPTTCIVNNKCTLYEEGDAENETTI